tara:strand:+ start:516 stop:644 length:129 start_codon:yes stop_codon:yes gene_type:complete
MASLASQKTGRYGAIFKTRRVFEKIDKALEAGAEISNQAMDR